MQKEKKPKKEKRHIQFSKILTAIFGAFMLPKPNQFLCPLCALKHSLQYTGLSVLGAKGTWVGFPHSAHTASNISRGALRSPPFLRPRLHSLQRVGSFWKPCSA